MFLNCPELLDPLETAVKKKTNGVRGQTKPLVSLVWSFPSWLVADIMWKMTMFSWLKRIRN